MKNTNSFKNTFDDKKYVLRLDLKPVLIPSFNKSEGQWKLMVSVRQRVLSTKFVCKIYALFTKSFTR